MADLNARGIIFSGEPKTERSRRAARWLMEFLPEIDEIAGREAQYRQNESVYESEWCRMVALLLEYIESNDDVT